MGQCKTKIIPKDDVSKIKMLESYFNDVAVFQFNNFLDFYDIQNKIIIKKGDYNIFAVCINYGNILFTFWSNDNEIYYKEFPMNHGMNGLLYLRRCLRKYE